MLSIDNVDLADVSQYGVQGTILEIFFIGKLHTHLVGLELATSPSSNLFLHREEVSFMLELNA